MRILMLSSSFNIGGAERQITDLARVLRDRGYQIRIISLTPLGPVGDAARACGLEVESLNMTGSGAGPAAIYRLNKIIRDWNPHIVHSHLIHANIIARLFRTFRRIPLVVSTVHSFNEGKWWGTAVYRLTEPLVDKTVFVSGMSASRYVRAGAVTDRKQEIIPNGIDFSLFQQDAQVRARLRKDLHLEGNFVWLAAGRLEKVKDYPTLFRAFTKLLQVKADNVLLVAGEGALKKQLWGLVQELGIARHVRLLGLRDDIAGLMNAADGFVLSSRYEGFGRVLVEAMACGLPVISTACGGPVEILKQGEYGALVPVGNHEQLARAMVELTGNNCCRASLEIAARYVKQAYDLTDIVARWERLYTDLLAGDKDAG